MNKSRLPSVYAVIPVFNGKQHTQSFLESFSKQSYRNLHIIIVDDGSTDGTSEMIAKKYPKVIVLKGDGNLWWSGATNLGVKKALSDSADFILTINNDLVVKRDYVSSLVNVAQEHPKSLVGSLIIHDKEPLKVWYAGAYLNKRSGEMQHIAGDVGDFKKDVVRSEWLTGMGVLIPARVFNKIGYYDIVNFPQYFGDADFSIRAKLSGFPLIVSTQSVISSDVDSSWLHKQIAKPKLRSLYDLLFSIRSPYQLKTRIKFLRLYFGASWPILAMKFYLWTLKGTYIRLVLALLGVRFPRRNAN